MPEKFGWSPFTDRETSRTNEVGDHWKGNSMRREGARTPASIEGSHCQLVQESLGGGTNVAGAMASGTIILEARVNVEQGNGWTTVPPTVRGRGSTIERTSRSLRTASRGVGYNTDGIGCKGSKKEIPEESHLTSRRPGAQGPRRQRTTALLRLLGERVGEKKTNLKEQQLREGKGENGNMRRLLPP